MRAVALKLTTTVQSATFAKNSHVWNVSYCAVHAIRPFVDSVQLRLTRRTIIAENASLVINFINPLH